ncbi:MAG TPA: hypothetical protein VE133_15505, partial [Candidatus Sulfotelmatobacter sp.]|nr:hypothetical protein [Candidatus Sulfotelmatobacter sp.]
MPAAVLDSTKLKELYSTMLKCRRLTEKVRDLAAASGLNAPNETLSGREALLVGAAAHALAQDSIITAKNTLLAEFIKGAQLSTLLENFLDCANAVQMTDTDGDSARLALARRMLLMNEAKAGKRVLFAFWGEDQAAASSQNEALALAAKDKLPLVCLVEMELSLLAEAEGGQAVSGNASGQNMDYYFPRIVVDGA